MNIFDTLFETRSVIETRSVGETVSTGDDPQVWRDFFKIGNEAHTGEYITADKAMTVGAIASGVNFIAGQIASLPLRLYKKTDQGPQEFSESPIYFRLHDVVNSDGVTSFDFRKSLLTSYLINGRGYALIRRAASGAQEYFNIDYNTVTPKLVNGKRFYDHNPSAINGSTSGFPIKTYPSSEIIDLCQTRKSDGFSHYKPIECHRDTIALAIAAEKYASSTLFNNGVPPLQLTTTDTVNQEGAEKAERGFRGLLEKARRAKFPILVMGKNSKLEKIGFDPSEMQLLDLKKFLIVQIAQMLSLPQFFLQSLEGSTFSNGEIQGQTLVKHTLAPIAVQFQQEFNTKILKNARDQYIELDLDGLMRGAQKDRNEFIRTLTQGGIMTANEARKMLNLPAKEGGDVLMVQGAMVPMAQTQQEQLAA